MVSSEERGKQSSGKWHSRLAQERLGLSVSVEEALVDSVLQERSGEPTDSMHTTHERALFPPRLSLQSRPIAALRPARMVSSTGDDSIVVSADAKHEQKSTTGMHDTAALRHYTHYSPASLATPESLEVADLPPGQLPLPGSQFDAASVAPAPERLADKGVTAISYPLAAPGKGGAQIVPQRQRVIGQTAKIPVKIRLETLPALVIAEAVALPTSTSAREHVARDLSMTSTHLPTVGSAYEEAHARSTPVPVALLTRMREGNTSTHLPAIEIFNGESYIASRGILTGSGAIERGQSDVTIDNSAITASSVVLVMLTSNPGPVAVHYVSLHVLVGFTLHLTAPTTMKTAFNYMLYNGPDSAGKQRSPA